MGGAVEFIFLQVPQVILKNWASLENTALVQQKLLTYR